MHIRCVDTRKVWLCPSLHDYNLYGGNADRSASSPLSLETVYRADKQNAPVIVGRNKEMSITEQHGKLIFNNQSCFRVSSIQALWRTEKRIVTSCFRERCWLFQNGGVILGRRKASISVLVFRSFFLISWQLFLHAVTSESANRVRRTIHGAVNRRVRRFGYLCVRYARFQGIERPCLHDPYLNEEHRQNGLYASNQYAASVGGYHRAFRSIDLLPDDPIHMSITQNERLLDDGIAVLAYTRYISYLQNVPFKCYFFRIVYRCAF